MKNEMTTILFAGDLCMRENTEKAILDGRSEEILADILPTLQEKDILVVNLENPLTSNGIPIVKSGPNLRANPRCVDLLSIGGFDVASLANNHMGDFGCEPVIETINLLHEKNIKTVGAGNNLESARKPLFIDKKGIRIAFLAFAENEFGIADRTRAGAAPLDPLSNINDIKEAASLSDITLVMVHGGNEMNPVPSPRMVQTYHSFIDAGASAVIGNHTHCPEGIEIFKGAPIVYSLGNFLFGVPQSQLQCEDYDPEGFWWKSFMLRLSFKGNVAAGIEIIPYSFAPDATKITLMTGEQKQDFLKYHQYLSDIITNPEELLSYWHGWCMTGGRYYLEKIAKSWSILTDDGRLSKNVVELDNLFTCEAHHEMMKTYLKMLCVDGIAKVTSYESKIKGLQKGIIPN